MTKKRPRRKPQGPIPDFLYLAKEATDESPYTGTLCSLLETVANINLARGARQAAANAAGVELSLLLLDDYWIFKNIQQVTRVITEGKSAEAIVEVFDRMVELQLHKMPKAILGAIFRNRLRKAWREYVVPVSMPGPGLEATKKKRRPKQSERRTQGELF